MRLFLITIVFFSTLLLGACSFGSSNDSQLEAKGDEYQTRYVDIPNSEKKLSVKFPNDWFENPKDNPYDLQFFSKKQNMNAGIFIYKDDDFASDVKLEEVLEVQVKDLRSKRENFEELENVEIKQLENAEIATGVYVGEKGYSRFHYKMSALKFLDSPEVYVTTIQVAFPSEWHKAKPILDNITESIKVIEKE